MCSLPEDQVILYRKRKKTDTDVADSAGQSTEQQVNAIPKFTEGHLSRQLPSHTIKGGKARTSMEAVHLLGRVSSTSLRELWKKTASELATLSDLRIPHCLSLTSQDHGGVSVYDRPETQLCEDIEDARALTQSRLLTVQRVDGLRARTSCY
ncbi:hypothetical protein MTO96_048699 [Rhipicephalus appendiculatus]